MTPLEFHVLIEPHARGVGPRGVRRTPRLAARYAREFNPSQAEVDRRAGQLGLSAPAGIVGTPTEAADHIQAFVEAGTERIYLELLDMTDHEQLRLFVEAVLPQLD